jgi:hypothetical protein
MGEAADDVLNGCSCQECGVWMDDMFKKDGKLDIAAWNNPPGHPRICEDCKNGK